MPQRPVASGAILVVDDDQSIRHLVSTAEQQAFETYRKARRAYLEFLRGAGGLAIMLALHLH